MKEKAAPYYVGAGILFAISGFVSQTYGLAILGGALVVIGLVMKKES